MVAWLPSRLSQEALTRLSVWPVYPSHMIFHRNTQIPAMIQFTAPCGQIREKLTTFRYCKWITCVLNATQKHVQQLTEVFLLQAIPMRDTERSSLL